ncbi:MAG: hypothetical protein AB4050_04790 [Synechococcus sp.]
MASWLPLTLIPPISMQIHPYRTSIALVALATAAACSPVDSASLPESHLKPTEELTVSVYPDPTAEFCRPKTLLYTGIEQPVRRVEAMLRMTGPDASSITEIPFEAILTGYDGLEVVRKEDISIHNFEVDCDELAIEIQDMSCFDDSRQTINCPAVVLDTAQDFKSVSLTSSQSTLSSPVPL